MPFGKNLEWLIEQKNVPRHELADRLNVKVNTISNYITGVSYPKFDILEIIIKFLDVTADELLYSDLPNDVIAQENALNKGRNASSKGVIKGEKTVPKTVPNSVPNQFIQTKGATPKVVTIDSDGKDNIVIVPAKAAAGYLNGFGDPEFMQKLPAYTLPGFTNGSFRGFEVKGNSMNPTLSAGDVVIARWEYLEDMRSDRVYVFVTLTDGIVVKRAINRIQTDGKIILKSDNRSKIDNYTKQEFPDIVLNPEDILELWYVRAKLSYQLPPPGETYSRLLDLEGRFALLENKLNDI